MSVVTMPVVLFLDEPTTGLDPRSRREVWDAVRTLAGSGVTVLLTTQYLEEADQLADRIAVLDHGRVVAEGTATELKGRVGTETLELAFDSAAAAGRGAHVLRRHAVVASDAGADDSADTLRVPTDGNPATVVRILTALADAGVPATTLTLHAPTLDDVFLHLTDTATTNRSA
jgi:ABC-2 type transport system ATP-binding protein